jgi:hypothetical protein
MSAPLYELGAAALLGLGTTSSSIVGAVLGLYVRFSRRILACILAFAAGALISALAIELGYEGAQVLHHSGLTSLAAWAFISVGFAAGAMIYYVTSLFLEGKGAAVRYATQFREYALMRKRDSAQERIQLLAKCDQLRHCRRKQSRTFCLAFRRSINVPARLYSALASLVMRSIS